MYILTRFNIALHKHEDRYPDYDAYMQSRIEWFELTTIPSVKNQSCKNFEWLVLIDSATPDKWKRKIYSLSDCFWVVEIDSDSLDIGDAVGDGPQSKIGIEAMRRFGYNPKDLIITSRLDNDDCLARHYVWRVRKSLNRPRSGIQFVQGYYWYHAARLKGKFYNSVYKKNMFPAVIEKGDSLKTVFEIDHPRLEKKFNVDYQNGGAMWLYNWLPDGLNLQNFTSRFAKKSGYPRCQGATISNVNPVQLKRVFGIDVDVIKKKIESGFIK